MERTELSERLETVAEMLAIEDYTITEHTDRVQLEWLDETDENLKRIVGLRENDDKIIVEYDVWYDNYETMERSWFAEELAEVNSEYPTVLMEALQRAFEEALNTTRDQLEVIDGIPNEA